MQKTKWHYKKQAPEKAGISKTIPDQSMSVREIMLKHSRGIDVHTKVPQYHTEEELDTLAGIDVRRLDIVEVHDELDKLGNKLEEKAKEIEEWKKKKSAEEEEQKIQQLKEQWSKENQQTDPAK